MNYKALQDEVLAHGFAESYRTRVKTWLNQSQARIARHVEIRELYATSSIATVGGTATYSLPSDFVRATGVMDVSNQIPLDYVPDVNILRVYNAGTANQGTPVAYSLGESGLLLAPVPNGVTTLTLTYYKRPTDMSADGDVSILPADYHDLMVSWTLSRAYRAEDDVQMSQFHMSEYQRDLGLLSADRQFEDDQPRQVEGTWPETEIWLP